MTDFGIGPVTEMEDVPGYEDPVKALRAIADEMESGKFGKVITVAISMLADGDDGTLVHNFGVGPRASYKDALRAYLIGISVIEKLVKDAERLME